MDVLQSDRTGRAPEEHFVEFEITSQDGDKFRLDTPHWLHALAQAMDHFNIDVRMLGRVNCIPESDGSIFIDDVKGQRSFMLRPLAPQIRVVASAASVALDEEPEEVLPPREKEDEAPLPAAPPPSLNMPVTSTFKRDIPESLAERLFDLSMDIAMAEPDDACRLALELVNEFVGCQASSVARGTLNDPALKFVAATGPVAGEIIGKEVQFGEGLVGMCFDLRSTVQVNDVSKAQQHLDQFDQQTGFNTLSVLCVPVLDDEGLVYGVIQLLNPSDRRFFDEDEEAVETIARTLANSLAEK